jgi:CBS-domain-containing membrane protein
MRKARDIMIDGVECIGENETLADAARKMGDLDVGSLLICGDDNRLKGMVTDRDIVISGWPTVATRQQPMLVSWVPASPSQSGRMIPSTRSCGR